MNVGLTLTTLSRARAMSFLHVRLPRSRSQIRGFVASLCVFLCSLCIVPLSGQELTTLNWEFSSQGLPITANPPRSVTVRSIISQPNRFAPTTSLFAATAGAGVYRSIDSGRTWAAVNTGLGGLNVNTLFVDDFTLYAGTTEGLFRTIDGGQLWTRVPVGVGGFFATFITAGVVASIDNRTNIFVGTANGVFRTTDGGQTWSYISQGLAPTQYITALLYLNRRLFAGTPSDGVLYYSLDSANASWQQPFQGVSPLPVTSFTTFANQRIFAGTNGGGVWRSNDVGSTWNPVNVQLDNTSITALATFGDRVYAATAVGVFATANLGTFWTNINTGFPIRSAGALYPFAGQLFAASGGNILRGSVFPNRPPVVTLLSPSSVPARQTGESAEITLRGTDFNEPLVLFEGQGLQRLQWTPNAVTVVVPGSLLASDGVKTFTLQNADGQRTTALFTVSGAVAPFISRVAPDSVTAGDPAFDFQIIGSAFFNSTTNPDSVATATLAGVPIPITQRIGSVALFGRVPEEAVSVAGRKFVRVTNPNGQFFDFPFRVRAFPPFITELEPPRVSVGNSDFDLVVSGRNFFTFANVEAPNIAPLTVRLAGVPLQIIENTTSSRVVVRVPATLVTSEATLSLRLTNDDGQFSETSLSVVPFTLAAISTPQPSICPGAVTPLASSISSGVPPYRVEWFPPVNSSSIDANGVIRAFISPTVPTRYTLRVTDRDGAGVPLEQSIQIGVLQPQAEAPAFVAFDTVNTFFRLSTMQTIRFANTSPDGTRLTLDGIRSSSSGAFRLQSGIGASVAAGESIEVVVVFEPRSDGVFLDTLRLAFSPCDRFVSVVVSGARQTPVLPPPVLLPVATQPDGRVPAALAPPLSWLPSFFLSVPSSYTIQIARVDALFSPETGFAAPLFTTSVNQATTVLPSFALQPNAAYAWTVRAFNSVTTSTFAVPFYFVTPPAPESQRIALEPTRLEFGDAVVNDVERRGLEARLITRQTSALDIVGAEIFPPTSAPRAAFAFSPAFARSTVTERTSAHYIVTFSPLDTALYQGVARVRSQAGDTVYALLSGRGVECAPDAAAPECAETEIAFRFLPFPGDKPRPEIGDTVRAQVILRSSNGLNAPQYQGRAQRFNADVWIENANVLFPLSVVASSNLSSSQLALSPNRIRLRDVPAPRGGLTNNIVLAEITLRALLTDTLTTALRLAEFTWTDLGQTVAGTPLRVRRVLRDTLLTVETCEIGGVRLIRPRPSASLLSLLSVAPNPVNTYIRASFSLTDAAPVEISLLNSLGVPVLRRAIEADAAGDYALDIRAEHLVSGVYLLVVRSRGETQSRQIIVAGQ